MVVWHKQTPAGNTGTASKFGSDDLNVHDKYHAGDDVTSSLANPTVIGTPTTFKSSILKVGNGTNSNVITITSSAQSANYNLNIPALAASTDLLLTASNVSLSSANTWTAIQTVQSDNQRLIKLYRPINTANTTTGFEFQFNNSTPAQTTYGYILGKLITNTAGAEDSSTEISNMKAGTITKVFSIDKNGLLTLGSGQNLAVGGYLKNSGVVTTTASSTSEFDLLNFVIPANLLGTNGAVKVRLSGYILQNDATARDFIWKIKFGTTIVMQDTLAAITQSATNRPFHLDFIVGNLNSTSSQGISGVFMQQDSTAATVGEGSFNDDEMHGSAAFRGTDPAKATTSNQTLQVTMQMSFSAATVTTTVQRQIIEFVPGV